MGGHFEVEHYREALIFLAIAGIVIPIVQRLKVSPVLGFIVAGLLLGPHALGKLAASVPWLAPFAITSTTDVAVLAELGVVFLLFIVGLELSFERLWSMRRLVFGLGAAQVVVCGAAIGLGAAMAGLSMAVAVIVGACLALSSTAIVLQVLAARGHLRGTVGRTSFSILLFQDLAVVPILFLIAVLGVTKSAPAIGHFAMALAQAVAALAFIVILGRSALRPLFRLVARTRSRELFMAATLFVVIGTAVATAVVGLSMALGAFLAGLLMAETEFQREVEIDIEPFKGLLLGVFFVAVGMSLDFAVLAANAAVVGLATIALLFAKAVIITLLVRAFGVAWPAAAEAGVLLAGAGEFALVALGLARSKGLIDDSAAQALLLLAIVTMLLTPLLAVIGQRLGALLQRLGATRSGSAELEPEATGALIVGYGRVGRLVSEMLEEAGLTYIAIDVDADLVTREKRHGRPVIYGNASRPELLRRVGLLAAETVIITMDDPQATEHVVAAVRAERADVTIIARARDAPHAAALFHAGATEVISETLEASLDLARAALASMGDDQDRLEVALRTKRQALIAALRA